ncbi:MAG: HAMP domain-containing protein [Chromatiaceae bacterium]|nr:HAMP domain-containing protein [Chromatiaceae bacterium]
MRLFSRLLPASLFGRALLTLILTFGLFAAGTFTAMVQFALAPVSQRSAADLASIMVLSARTLSQLPPAGRDLYRQRLEREYQISLREVAPACEPGPGFFPYLYRVEQALGERLGRAVHMRASREADGERWFWVALEEGHASLWGGFPRSRVVTRPAWGLAVILVMAVFSVLASALILARRVTEPLKRLSRAAEEVALGQVPAPLPEQGPSELVALARRFNEAARQIRELIANRTLLLTGISHDLRTPLTRLRLALEMLPEAAAPELVARMARDIEEMNGLIGEAVRFGRTLGVGRRERIELGALIADVIAAHPRVRWHPGHPCPCAVDPLALRRILGNLLENALRYSDEAVEVRLYCGAHQVLLRVLDRGPGIPEEELEAVLRPYYRLEHSRSRDTGGSGLGLAVAHQLALANQMELHLGLRAGGGTVAGVRFARGVEDGSEASARECKS